MNALPEKPLLNRRFRMQYEPAQQAHVLLYPEGMVRLNQSAAEILKRCDGSATVDEIIAQLEAAFNATGLRDDVLGMLSHAQEKDWIR
ncbi:MAG TPA: pyrroloquinoline quinone biosynthesis peptide chaperone PqqD [Noviherbaspirillum sp.]|jgi:pyrroloquinoline quinone biosynthesis protein D|uniref:pyrroloquinoline quinone biosynthesis peptide chaperone PqqD n=1 Tax=Noviherbaspirillum sp. L7-7A TaxID=2850560 RepID=UPI001C2B93FA|nr:pyrroloquinoline quinone biosynthesis peptide chaperone PqqD [Noviherbaspirillum sp. L7-7A]MBV0881721.1 pyrroloquinoline quinone biosynthesis peptide chaperone PqqD [Noviherbaspirillum sp. L7-7A]